ncbi:hypothetical protein RFI_40332 [Reticulomyxa filosa]|uniref:Uncharacterized protein n=1 Tax=Reticulomyxa filosa TaxID=46433 RepID=X6L8Y2_RETFI|nr:hypothetical protein RFI_40332 [Reticulomyxa filosa]|eukprot:ETN97199.1 hypothetical protein RFI_40332 [Reticulomyxa filosa]
MEKYKKYKELHDKLEVDKIIKKMQKNINEKNENKFYNIIRNIKPRNQIILHNETGKAIHSDIENCMLLGNHYINLFKHTESNNNEWKTEIRNKVKEYLQKHI